MDSKMMDSKMIIRADERTWDVLSNKTFDQLLIHPNIVNRLLALNFTTPTPVQAGAIPLGLLGNDLLVQAKSGTGKTLVFAVLIASAVTETAGDGVVAVVVAPVREIALQIKEVVDKITPEGTRSCVFIGGEDVKDNKATLAQGCSVAIGTPGRLAQLLREGALDFKQSKLFVLDESDKLMDDSFTADVKHIYNSLNPETTQVAAFSATYPNNLDEYLSDFMKAPVTFRLDSGNVQLLGIHQYALDAMGQKETSLVSDILDKMSFSQAVIFANDTKTCDAIFEAINRAGKHKATVMSSSLSQDERKKVITALKNFAVRIMVSTDVTARGIDALNVNLVINIGVPKDPETYLHRIGRAGRYGGNGASITLLTNPQDLSKFIRMAQTSKLNVKSLEYSNIPYDLTYNEDFFKQASSFVDHCSKKVENIKAQVSGPSISQDRSSVAASEAPLREKETVEKNAKDSKAETPSPSTSALAPVVEETPETPQEVPAKENKPAAEGIAVSADGRRISTSHINPDVSRSTSGTSQTSSTKSHGGLLSEFKLKKNVQDWNYDEPKKRLEKIELPLALVDVEKVRQFVPGFEYDEEAATANAIKDLADQPVITGVVWVPPPPRRARGFAAPNRGGGRGRGGFEGGNSRGGASNAYEGGSQRGGYNNEGGYGGRGRGDGAEGGYGGRGRGDGTGYGRGNFGSSRGGYNNDAPSRGGYNNEAYSRGGFNNDRGRGAYNNDAPSRGNYNNDAPSSRGGYNNDAPSRGGYNNDGFGRGGHNAAEGTSRGGYNNEGGYGGRGRGDGAAYGRGGNFGSSRGGYNNEGRGGFNNEAWSRGGYKNDAPRGGYSNDGISRGGYNNDAPSRGNFNNDGLARGGYNNDSGFGRGGGRGGGRGNFNNEEGTGYMGGARGAFTRGGRGGFDQQPEQEGGEQISLQPTKRFVR